MGVDGWGPTSDRSMGVIYDAPSRYMNKQNILRLGLRDGARNDDRPPLRSHVRRQTASHEREKVDVMNATVSECARASV